uniref:NADH:quinone oxidoreductase/Mrp antiporter transmembrane domain-containing protein n=1 Tax=Morchella brunnea TaxID=1174671 RepID=A0A8K1I7Q4_9PEZI|nr:hypothetical protein LK370_mgp133 [Morchella brunnea]UBU98443.1 hypothetical protein [Morchella brunnea]
MGDGGQCISFLKIIKRVLISLLKCFYFSRQACIFFSFAVKTPLIFLNTWLLKAHVESPLSGSIVLAAIVLKLRLYGAPPSGPLSLRERGFLFDFFERAPKKIKKEKVLDSFYLYYLPSV